MELSKRIAYYTKKAAQWSSKRGLHEHRFNRLMVYKKAVLSAAKE